MQEEASTHAFMNTHMFFLLLLAGCATSPAGAGGKPTCDRVIERYDDSADARRRMNEATNVRDCFARLADAAGFEAFLAQRKISQVERHRAAFAMYQSVAAGGDAAETACAAYANEKYATVVDLRNENLAPVRAERWFSQFVLRVLERDFANYGLKAEAEAVASEFKAARLPVTERLAALANPSAAMGTFVAIEGEVRSMKTEGTVTTAVLDAVRVMKRVTNVKAVVVSNTVFTERTLEEEFVPEGRVFVVVIENAAPTLLAEPYWLVYGVASSAAPVAPRATTVAYWPTDFRRVEHTPLQLVGNGVPRKSKRWTER